MSNNNNTNEPEVQVNESERKLLLDHSYDNIHELDHPLPNWWLGIFWGTSIFALFYFILYQFMGAPSLRQTFEKDWAKIQEIKNAEMAKGGAFNSEKYQAILAADGVKKGEEVFTANCVACHKEKGAGDIGPNLTDEYWLWAKGTPETIYPVVHAGVPQNGMPTWGGVLSDDEIYQAVAYVQTLHNTHTPGGKAPQGEKVDDAAAAAPAEAPATN